MMLNKQIYIKLSHGKTETLNINKSVTTLNLKNIIKKKYRLNSDFFLTRDAKILKNQQPIFNGDHININFRLKGGFLNTVLNLFKETIRLFSGLGKLIDKIIMLFEKFLDLFSYIISPTKLISAIVTGLLEGIKILLSPLNFRTYKKKKQNKKQESKKNYCFKTKLLKIVILVLCPPLAIFIHKGFAAFLPIIISTMLTFYLYYFPGLIFSSLYLLN